VGAWLLSLRKDQPHLPKEIRSNLAGGGENEGQVGWCRGDCGKRSVYQNSFHEQGGTLERKRKRCATAASEKGVYTSIRPSKVSGRNLE